MNARIYDEVQRDMNHAGPDTTAMPALPQPGALTMAELTAVLHAIAQAEDADPIITAARGARQLTTADRRLLASIITALDQARIPLTTTVAVPQMTP